MQHNYIPSQKAQPPQAPPLTSIPPRNDFTNAGAKDVIIGMLNGDKPQTAEGAQKLFDVLKGLLADWAVQDLPEAERVAVSGALYVGKALVKEMEVEAKWCCPWLFSK